METKINIAKILKNKQEGTKLWTDMFGSVTLYVVTDACDAFQVKHHNKEPWFDKDGKLYEEGVLCIYPSKSMRDWSKFAWKKGDVLVSNDGKCKVIFDKFDDDKYTSFIGKHYLESYGKDGELQDYEEIYCGSTVKYTKESEEAAQTYINTIEERLGGKLNHETLEIENAKPEFKDGDIAFADYGNRQDVFIVSDKTDLSEGYSSFISLDLNILTLSMGCRTTFFKKDLCKLRLATEEEKQQLFSALEKEGKAFDTDKKQIVDLKPKWTPKTFDRVITRNDDYDIWTANFFSHMDSHGEYVTIGCVGGYTYCIPYNEENAKLIGTTNNVEDYV